MIQSFEAGVLFLPKFIVSSPILGFNSMAIANNFSFYSVAMPILISVVSYACLMISHSQSMKKMMNRGL